ncbi:cyclopropane-fatty-acyl-phospholipid synthase [Nemania diffusa]|nr:cyclopropane-fatty-acyl-phospholipid synthase [Nemania diffusa]
MALVDFIKQYVGRVAWDPAVQISRKYVLSLFRKINVGQLRVGEGKDIATYGKASRSPLEPHSEITVHKEAFWVRMLLFADMGFAESYMLGEISCPDLTSFFEIFIRNRDQLSDGTTLASSISLAISSLARTTNTLANSRLNVSAHYDISNEMFAAFLSPDMTYSCAIWRPKSDPKSSVESLEQAQQTKLKHIIDSAHIKSTDHILEIGTGWGSFAILAVNTTGCRVTSLTLSAEQKELAEQRIAEAGLAENIEVLLCDYRACPTPKDTLYDKIISIEMLEHVGKEYLKTYFECVDRLLKPNGGIAVFQCSTMPNTRYENYSRTTDFIRKYIFPGCHLPTVSFLFSSIQEGSQGRLIPSAFTNIGAHYSRTLREWRKAFLRNFDAQIKPALLAEHDDMTDSDVELFKRKWEYYFTYCEAGFRTATLGDAIITVGREGCEELAEGVAL